MTPADSERIEDAVARFDAAWRAGTPPPLEDAARAAGVLADPWRLVAQLVRVEFEWRLKRGERVRVEEYADRYRELRASPADEWALVRIEYAARRRAEALSPDEFVGRFPSHRSALLNLFSGAAGTPPPEVPGYDVYEKLGEGGMGAVFRGRDRMLDRVVALKVLTAPGAADEPVLVARVDHPNVVRVYETGFADGGRPYFAMEYLAGGSLHDRLAAGVLPPGEAAGLVEVLARAVDAAHRQGIVHRDLKPGNVLLTAAGEPKVSDFGLARQLAPGASHTHTLTLAGSWEYMAAEQAAGGNVGPRADVYGLGAVLYACLTGRPPVVFDRDTPAPVRAAVLTARDFAPVPVRALRAGVPCDLAVVCETCLRRDPARRYASAAALAADLRNVLDGRPVAARPLGVVERGWKWVRRHPVPVAGAGLVAVALGAAGFGVVQQRDAAQARADRLDADRDAVAARADRIDAQQERVQAERRAAAEAALRGGRPREALELLRATERDGVPVTGEMRLLEADALVASGPSVAAARRLQETGADFPPELAARRDLRLGDLHLGADDARAVPLIRRAARGPGLSPAEQRYADGILIESPSAALRHFESAVAAHPDHVPTRRAFALLLLSHGRLDEAIGEAERGRLLAPDHPDFAAVEFLANALRGHTDAALRAYERVRPAIPVEQQAGTDVLNRVLPLLSREFEAAVYGGEPPAAPDELAQFHNAAGQVDALLGVPTDGDRAERLLRLPPAARNAMRAFLEVMQSAGPGLDAASAIAPDDARAARLAAQAADSPEGFVRFVHTTLVFTRALRHQEQNPTDRPGFRSRMADAGAAYETAADSPGLIDARRVALEKAVVCYALAGKPSWAPDPNPVWVGKAVALARRRLNERESLHPVNFEVFTKAARNGRDHTTARRLLDLWEAASPGDLNAARLRAQVEEAAGADGPALRAAGVVLAREPNDGPMRELADRCRSRVRSPPE